MPELPEVETTRRGIAPHVVGRRIAARARIRPALALAGSRRPRDAARRARRSTRSTAAASTCCSASATDTLLVHLGMTGSLRVFTRAAAAPPARPRRHRPRRRHDAALPRPAPLRRDALARRRRPTRHPLLARLGPEPFDAGFDADYLLARDAPRRAAIKLALMDNHLVVGVGQHLRERVAVPRRHPADDAPPAGCRGARLARLVDAVRATLAEAIAKGGSDAARLRRQRTASRATSSSTTSSTAARAMPCRVCGTADPDRAGRGGRATFYCPRCQR